MLNKRERAIIASIHMRSAIKGLGGEFKTQAVVTYIDMRCYKGEMKYYKAKPFNYDMVQKVCKVTAELYDRKYSNQEIATDTFLDCLYHNNEHEFKNYFKLKDNSFGVLFQKFGEQDELEKISIEAADYITDCIDKAEEIYHWRLWVKRVTRRTNCGR